MAASSYDPSVPQLTLQVERTGYLQVHTGLPATLYSCNMAWELCHTAQRCFACKDDSHLPRGNYMDHKGFSSLLGNWSSRWEVRIYTSTIEYIASHTIQLILEYWAIHLTEQNWVFCPVLSINMQHSCLKYTLEHSVVLWATALKMCWFPMH